MEDASMKQSAFYNVVEDKDKTEIKIQVALAGYAKSDIKVSLDKNIVTVSTPSGSSILPKGEDQNVRYRGLSNKKHNLKFRISEYAKISEVKFENGLLEILIVEEIPESKKPQEFEIK